MEWTTVEAWRQVRPDGKYEFLLGQDWYLGQDLEFATPGRADEKVGTSVRVRPNATPSGTNRLD